MSAQLSLDALGGIDWGCPKLAQLEQFVLDHVPGCKTRLESHNSSMCVAVEYAGRKVWLRPSLERYKADALRWYVRFEAEVGYYSWASRSDSELKACLEDMFLDSYLERDD